jgi:hypothetical protein
MTHIGRAHVALGFSAEATRRGESNGVSSAARCSNVRAGGEVIGIVELAFEARAVAGPGTRVVRRGESPGRA